MKVYHNIDSFQRLPYAVVTSGTFDGVHKGHQKILAHLSEAAHEAKGETVVITFWPHPRHILNPQGGETKVLSTQEEKIRLLEKYGVDHLLIIPFTKEFSQISSEQFINEILVNKIGTKKLVMGYDHRFGRNREGSFEYLKENASNFGFEVEEIPRQDIEDIVISSSNIRQALTEGNLKTANELLGYPYTISGTVERGKQLGRTIGFPTANIRVEEDYKLIPKDGIYAVWVQIGEALFQGMMSMGFNPTVNGTARTIEVNIFKFDRDIYEKKIRIFFVEYLRDEKKFEGMEALKEQIAQDKIDSEKVLTSYSINI